MKMHSVIHFEMPAKDMKRVADFYTKVFGWNNTMLGKEMGNYVLAQTVKSDEHGRPLEAGGINGGFYPIFEGGETSSMVIGVDDIDQHCKLVEKAGGKILNKKVKIPGIGWYVNFIDTEGNKVSMLQAEM